MLFLLLSIICSVTVGVLFKSAQGYNFSKTQIVTSNYAFALLFCYLSYKPELSNLGSETPWAIYSLLGVLLPSVFLSLVASIKHMGIVKTDAAQRLSLFIPILASWFIFKEEFTNLKIIAILVGFPALVLILDKPTQNSKNKWGYPIIVLLGFGLIDVLFKKIALYTHLPFTTSLFIVFTIAFVVMLAVMGYEMIFRNSKLNRKSLILGGFVGVFNFGNILFYLKAHQVFAKNPSTVFAGMNMGVIVVGSLVGIFIFKEKLTKFNYLGVLMALVAIFLIVISQSN
jgi:drug/metabolite transporter (DMT)-like permease